MSSSTLPDTSGAARIEAVNFGWRYPGREQPVFADLTFVIEPGQKVLLLGPSGAGKSTLLQAIAGVNYGEGESQLGSLTVNGLTPQRARGFAGLMQQDPESSVVLARVGDDVAFGPENLAVPGEEIWWRVREALAAVGLDSVGLEHSTSALSGGQKQRLGLAGILAMHPGALLLDEPTANLDPRGVVQVRDAVLAAQQARGATLVVIEHRVGIWAEHMDRVIVLRKDGGIAHDGTPREVLGDAADELVDAGVWVPGRSPQGLLPPRIVRGVPGRVLIRAEDLSISRTYPGRKSLRKRSRELAAGRVPQLDIPVVASGVNLEVREGEHLSIVGQNGAGKSTLALTLAGLLYPAAGQLLATEALEHSSVGGVSGALSGDIAGWNPADLVTRIGLVFQEPEQQFITSTVRDELEFGPRRVARIRQEPLDQDLLGQRCEELLDRLRLKQLEHAHPFTLSGGEKRRLSVASALATSPRVLVLDEPTFGQDAQTWAELLYLVRELLDEGTAVVSVTHDLDFVRSVGGSVFLMDGDRAGQTVGAEQL